MTNSNDQYAMWLVKEVKSGRMSRREFLGRTSALGIALATGTSLFEQALAATPKKGGHMRLGMGHGSTSDTLDPATIENGLQWVCAYGVSNTLVELAANGKLVPALATEWEASADAKKWTFKLRKGVEFHNGKTMTAEDVIASINFHRGETTKSVGKPLMAPITKITADDPHTVVIELSGGNADFPFNFNEATFGIFPAKDDGIDWAAGGSGGYKLKTENPGVRYDFERFANYWKDGAAHADTIQILSLKDPTARNAALVTGEVDAIDQVDLKTVHLMAKRPGITVEEGAGPLHYVFPMRTKDAPFDNPDVRKALKYALDREEMVKKILLGHGVIGNDHPIGPSYRYYAADIEQTKYDPDKAKFHMQKSGLGDIKINLHAADAAYAGALDAAQLFQESAKKAGININVVREPNDGYWSNVWNKKSWCASYWGGYTTEDTMFSTGYAPGAAWNDTQWDNPKFNKLLIDARAELDPAKRKEMYRDMQILLRDNGGVITPMFANAVSGRNDKIAHNEQSWVRAFDGRRIMERWWMV
ncbi:MAG: ABC transporter substrate-binding protein [Hyphomicrobiaceae bacterium]